MSRIRRLARAALGLWDGVGYLLDQALVPLAWLRRNENFITGTYAGGRTLAEATSIAIFVHFDRRGEVHDYVVYYLNALRAAGFDIIFIANGTGLSSRALARVTELCAAVLDRRNVGYDFAAYRDGLRFLGELSRFERLLLVNDSVYGPFFDLQPVLANCDDAATVWGMTDSWDVRYHLQSYFLLIGRAAMAAPEFAQFWDHLLPVQSKRVVIRRYEVGFTQAMLRAGLRCTALFPYRAAACDLTLAGAAGELSAPHLDERTSDFFSQMLDRVERGLPLNAMHQFWDHMIAQRRCPFIKRELLSRNPARIPHAHLWERLIGSVSGYDTDMIVRHLQVVARNRAP